MTGKFIIVEDIDVTELTIPNTPWEQYIIEDGHDSWPVWVKREDLCCPDPDGPSFSKIRGVAAHLEDLRKKHGDIPIGVLDTYHSKAGRGVAWVCNQMGMDCHVFYPVYTAELIDNTPWTANCIPNHHIREHQQVAAKLGAWIHPLKAGRSCILYHQAKKLLSQLTGDFSVMLPNGLQLAETVDATARELFEYTPDEILWATSTWVVSISSGTICAGVVRGVFADVYVDKPEDYPTVIAHMGYSRSIDSARRYILDMAWVDDPGVNLRLVDEGYAYKDGVDNSQIPFPANRFYDAKAWNWLVDNIHALEQPVIFWNIGD